MQLTLRCGNSRMFLGCAAATSQTSKPSLRKLRKCQQCFSHSGKLYGITQNQHRSWLFGFVLTVHAAKAGQWRRLRTAVICCSWRRNHIPRAARQKTNTFEHNQTPRCVKTADEERAARSVRHPRKKNLSKKCNANLLQGSPASDGTLAEKMWHQCSAVWKAT